MERQVQGPPARAPEIGAVRQGSGDQVPAPTTWRLQFLFASGRRLTLAYIGLWALVYDNIARLTRCCVQLVGSAEQRGERMDDAVRHRVAHLEDRAVGEMHKLQHELGHDVTQMQHDLKDAGAEFEDEVEKRIAHMMANLGIPTHERLARLNQELDRLNQKLDEELRRAQAAEIKSQPPAA
jgi:polyhydroxyalkanoate synthesis regulator phasin